MPVEKGQRLKLLKIWEILRQETDEAHPMSSVALLQRLEEIDIKCDRRTLYADIQALNESGYKIHCNRRKTNEYFVERREFSMAEIKNTSCSTISRCIKTAKSWAQYRPAFYRTRKR